MGKNIATSLLLATMLLFGTVTLAQDNRLVLGDLMICSDPGTGDLRPRVEVNMLGEPVVLWGRLSPSANFVSVGSGSEFSVPIMVHPEGMPIAVAGWHGSSMASDGSALWTVLKAYPDETQPCYVVRSDDGGYTWGDTIRVDNDSLVSRFPTVTVVPGVGPVVQYMQFASGWSHARYVSMRMVNGAFEEPVQMSAPFSPGEVCDCCTGEIVGDGTSVVGLYRNAGSNIRVIWGSSSSDGGMTYDTGGQLDNTNWNYNSCPSSGPDGYIAGDSVRYVWMSGATNSFRAYIGSASIDGLSVGTNRMVQGGGTAISQNYPRIAGSADTLGVVWQQGGSGVSYILLSRSTTGTQGLSTPDTLASGIPGELLAPDIAFKNGVFHLVWNNAVQDEVHYRSATIESVVGIEDARSDGAGLQLWIDPNGGSLRPISKITNGTVLIMDARGSMVLQQRLSQRPIDIAALSSGVYVVAVRDVTNGAVLSTRFAKP